MFRVCGSPAVPFSLFGREGFHGNPPKQVRFFAPWALELCLLPFFILLFSGGGVQLHSAHGHHGALVLRVLRVPRDEPLRGVLALRDPRRVQGTGGAGPRHGHAARREDGGLGGLGGLRRFPAGWLKGSQNGRPSLARGTPSLHCLKVRSSGEPEGVLVGSKVFKIKSILGSTLSRHRHLLGFKVKLQDPSDNCGLRIGITDPPILHKPCSPFNRGFN